MKHFLFVAFFIILATAAHALVDVTYTFNTNTVHVLAYNCQDSSCNQVSSFTGSFPQGQQTTNSQLTIRYPSTLASPHGYALFYTTEGYAPKEGRATWHSYGDNRVYTTTASVPFDKIPNCQAHIDDVSVINVATPYVPVIVQTQARLDALTQSAFTLTNNAVAYVPQELKSEFYSTDVRITLVVRDQTGNVVETQYTDFTHAQGNAIFADQAKPVRFEFTPQSAGQYTAIVTTQVIDNQCSSRIDQSAQKQFFVKQDLPQNECFTLLNNLQARHEDKTIKVSVNKLSTHVSNNPFAQATKTPLPTALTLWLKDSTGAIRETQSAIIGANPDTINPATVTFTLPAPTQSDTYTVIVAGQAESPLCTGLSNSREVLTANVFISAPKTYRVTFQLIDAQTGTHVANANILLDGKTAATTPEGTAVIENLLPGMYQYTITHPLYETTQGTVLITGQDVLLVLPLKKGTSVVSPPVPPVVVPPPIVQPTLPQTPPAPLAKKSRETFDVHISSLRIPDHLYLNDDSSISFSFSLKNTGNKRLERVKVSATLLDAQGTRRTLGPFHLGIGARVSKRFILDLPEDTTPGTYVLRFEIGNEKTRRAVHRMIDLV